LIHRQLSQIAIALTIRSERNRLCLLKDSLSRNLQKLDRVRMPYKRFSLIAWTFSIPQFWPSSGKNEFFNSHAYLQTTMCQRVTSIRHGAYNGGHAIPARTGVFAGMLAG
jgi:hypothetical protein